MPRPPKRHRSESHHNAPYNAASSRYPQSSKTYGLKTSTLSHGPNLIQPITGLGQHFLKNPAVVTGIIDKAGIKPTDVVLEIGPGTGNMTLPLLEQSKRVIVIEYDTRMIRELLKRTEGMPLEHKLTVIQGDAIKTRWPFFDACVANIPYQISSPLVFKLLLHRPMFRCAVIMFQEEFALRLTARPGDKLYCRLSVNTQLMAKVEQVMKVGRKNFRPPPKVDSRVVRIEPINPPPPINFIEWDGMIRLLFNRKNKTLRSVLMTKTIIKMLEENRKTYKSLRQIKDTEKMDIDTGEEEKSVVDIIEEVTGMIDWVGKRASKLGMDDFLSLLAEFNRRGIHFG